MKEWKKEAFRPMINPPYDVEEDKSIKKLLLPLSDTKDNQYKPLAPDVLSNVEGLDASSGSGIPPDPDIAAGPNHIVTVVNSSFAVYTKAGVKVQETTFSSWFSNVCSNCDPFDPRIAYDPHENHWILLAVHVDDANQISNYLLSVSQTSDPTGSWWNWNLNSRLDYNGTPTWSDYPDVGFDGISSNSGGAVYITSSQFTFPGSFRTSMLNILPKLILYTGSSLAVYWRAWDRLDATGTQAFTLRPAKTWGNPGSEFMINTGENNDNFITLWRVNPTYPPTAVDWTRQASVNIGTYQVPPMATQQGCSNTLDTIDNRIYNAVWNNNKIYGAFNQAFNFGSGTVSAIRYVAINTMSNLAEVNTIYGADGFHYWFPAISPNASDDITFVFARSSSSEFAGLHVTGRRAGATSTEASAVLRTGQECITGDRWGDYFGAARDPSDSTKVWVYGEWAKNVAGISASGDWGTQWSQTRYAPLTPPTAALIRLERSTGNFYADGAYFCGLASNCFNSSTGADLAERIDVSERVGLGDLVEPDPRKPKHYRKARENSQTASGVISTHPGFTLDNAFKQVLPSDREQPLHSLVLSLITNAHGLPLSLSVQSVFKPRANMGLELSVGRLLPEIATNTPRDHRPLLALLGRVPVKATTENGPISPGDLLLVSATRPGYAMKCKNPQICEGAVIGKALEALTDREGLILILVTSR
jgi:hypothetical protein